MHEQCAFFCRPRPFAIRQAQQQEFPVTLNRANLPPRQLFFEQSRIVDEVALADRQAQNRPPGDFRLQSPRDGFNFGQFRHLVPGYSRYHTTLQAPLKCS